MVGIETPTRWATKHKYFLIEFFFLLMLAFGFYDDKIQAMSLSRAEVNRNFHGPVEFGQGKSADYVVAHGLRQRQRGRRPSVSYRDEANPEEALEAAQKDIATRNSAHPRSFFQFSGKVAVLPPDVFSALVDPWEGKVSILTLALQLVELDIAVGVVADKGSLPECSAFPTSDEVSVGLQMVADPSSYHPTYS